jgi:O-antigen ligase
MAIMPLFFYSRLHRFKRYLVSVVIIVLSSQAYMLIYRLHGEGNIAISKLLSVFVNPVVALAFLALCLVFYLIAIKAPKKLNIAKKIYPMLLVLFVLSIGVCFILANTVGLGKLDELFKITSEWGTYRGKIWRYCVKSFLDFNIKDMLFGVGPESLASVTASAKLFEGKNLDQAHNEYLQYLMTTGIFGLAAYLGVIGTTIYTVIKKLRESTLAVALLAALVSYWMQATVNIAQPFTTPIIYIYIACIAGMARNAQKQGQESRAKGRVVVSSK